MTHHWLLDKPGHAPGFNVAVYHPDRKPDVGYLWQRSGRDRVDFSFALKVVGVHISWRSKDYHKWPAFYTHESRWPATT